MPYGFADHNPDSLRQEERRMATKPIRIVRPETVEDVSALKPYLLTRKRTHFVLLRPRNTQPIPQVVIGTFQPGNPPTLSSERVFTLQNSPTASDVWEIKATDCKLVNGQIYHYWFRVRDGHPQADRTATLNCTDPTAEIVDWRLRSAKPPSPPYTDNDRMPAGVVKFVNGQLIACDPGGEAVDFNGDVIGTHLPANNRLVLYELPTRWSRIGVESSVEIGTGTFRDVLALLDEMEEGANFASTPALRQGRAHLKELGINALEPLPIADSFADRSWGYATSNYFAPDFDLGRPDNNSSSTAASDLATLVRTCHANNTRFFQDMVMAFSTRGSIQYDNFLDYFVETGTGDPEEDGRNGFGGDLFKYNFFTNCLDPISGKQMTVVPARQLMKAQLARWMLDFRIDGIRMDSINNIMNYDFVQEFKDYARTLWHERWQAAQGTTAGADERFLVVGEELSVPMALLQQNRLDGLWNENFKRILRNVIVGKNDDNEPSFEMSVRKLIDCRNLGFTDSAQAINYVTSHDVEGFRNERLFNYLQNNGVVFKEKQIKLAFVCLLTAVGVPMILAGEEFADQHDLPITEPGKEIDPVNFDRLEEPWRKDIFNYVSRLVHLRTSSNALAVNDTDFIHVDFNDGKRVLAWQRGTTSTGDAVVVLANFSDWETNDPFNPNSKYRVNNWPSLPFGKKWQEITQQRDVPDDWAGNEPIFPWEAKVYAMVPVR
jgi:pullulanase